MNNLPSLSTISIRTELKPGDLERVTAMHVELYTRVYQFGPQFETYVAQGLREFYKQYDPTRNRIWICEQDKHMVGSLLLMDRGEMAQLRYFLIEPQYRNISLGAKLMTLFMDFLQHFSYQGCY